MYKQDPKKTTIVKDEIVPIALVIAWFSVILIVAHLLT